ncbi:MAG: hypothetical protein H6737_21875 [Alphaproteobacteria bacterium]|nr:hypothetical protein [Alphaproteobacteria bacterium]
MRSIGWVAFASVLVGLMACDGGTATPYGDHCDGYGPDFAAPGSPGNAALAQDCAADAECRTLSGRFTWDDGTGYCHAPSPEYVACVPDVIADPNACAPGATGFPGGPIWGAPLGRGDLCFRMDTPCMPEGFVSCSDPHVVTSGVCL